MADQKKFERLPSDVAPIHYDVWLKPDLKNLVFDGKVDILLKVKFLVHILKWCQIIGLCFEGCQLNHQACL